MTVEELFTILIYGSTPILLFIGFLFGKLAEKRHYESIHEREARLLNKPVLAGKILEESLPVMSSRLTVGSVVISVDYYKQFLMSFRQIFGGRINSYASLLDRGRREAILRMKENSPGADLFLNCRLQTSSIFSGRRNRQGGSVEVIAYSTAIRFAR